MPPETRPALFPDISPIYRLLRTARWLLRSSWLVIGLALTAGVACTLLTLAVLIDCLMPGSFFLLPLSWFTEVIGWIWSGLGGRLFTSARSETLTLWQADLVVRSFWLSLVVVLTGWVGVIGVVLPLLRSLGWVEMARRVESLIPGMHSRLATCVDLARNPELTVNYSPAFCQKLVRESLERIAPFRASRVVDRSSLLRALSFAAIAVGVFAALWLIPGDRARTTTARIFSPGADLPPAARVRLTVTPGNAKVLQGDKITFTARADRGRVEELRIVLLSPDATIAPIERRMEAKGDGSFTFTWNTGSVTPGFGQGFGYRIVGGHTWTPLQQIAILERPKIESVTPLVHYPAYMAIPRPQENPVGKHDLMGPQGAEAEIVVGTSGPVHRGTIQWFRRDVVAVPNEKAKQRTWFTDSLPKDAVLAGEWRWEASVGMRQARRAHSSPASSGTSAHSFSVPKDTITVHKGEVLFVDVQLDPTQVPEAILVQWHDDSDNLEHRAFWGADRFTSLGTLGTAGRLPRGPLPRPGEWVRLEVPAKDLDLEGKRIKGMSFLVFQGRALWGAVGTGEPTVVFKTVETPIGSVPLTPKPDQANVWVGRFRMESHGFYRIELRNELGHTNETWQEASITVVPDKAPLIELLTPGDLTLSPLGPMDGPEKKDRWRHPLQASAEDDFGLQEVWLAVQREGSSNFERVQKLRDYPTPNPARKDVAITSILDPAALGLTKAGDALRYRVEVRDRRPEEVIRRHTPAGMPVSPWVASKDFSIRIIDDPNSVDRKLDQLEKTQDAFQKKLEQLLAEQKKVHQKLEQSAKQFQPLNDKIKAAEAEQARQWLENKAKESANQPNDPKAAKPHRFDPQQLPPPNLDPMAQAELAKLRAELGKLAQEEAKNAALAKQLEAELNQLGELAKQLPQLPLEIREELQNLKGLFEQTASKPLQNLTQELQRRAQPQPKGPLPDTEALKQRSDRLNAELEAFRDRLQALSDAQKGMRQNPEAARQKLREDLTQEQTRLQARQAEERLRELRDFIKNLREELDRLQGQEEQLRQRTAKADANELAKIDKEQTFVEDLLEQKFEQTKKLLDSANKAKRKRPKDLPKEPPFTPEGKERTAPPREEDTEEPEMKKEDDEATKTPFADPKKDPQAEKEPHVDEFFPVLNGEKFKEDPRFAQRKRPTPPRKPRPPGEKLTPEQHRQELTDRENQQLDNIDRAQQALQADQEAIEQLMQQLRNQMNAAQKSQANPRSPMNPMNDAQQDSSPMAELPSEVQRALQQLQQTLQSPQMKNAQAMAQRMQQAKQQAQAQTGQTPMQQGQQPNLSSATANGSLDARLDDLDLKTRAILLKLPPRVREELLQGMKDQGPEGYREFIQQYFNRLSELQQK